MYNVDLLRRRGHVHVHVIKNFAQLNFVVHNPKSLQNSSDGDPDNFIHPG